MATDIHCFVEYRSGLEWLCLGRYRGLRDHRMYALVAGVGDCREQPVVAARGLPPDCSLDVFLAGMELRGSKKVLTPADLGVIRIGRMIGSDLTHLIGPSHKWRSHGWLTAAEFAQVLDRYRAAGEPEPAWIGLLAMLRHLPEGRLVFFFD